MNKNNLLYILMCFAMLTWGMAWTSAKIVNEYLNYNNLVFLRFFVGVLTMIPFVIFKRFPFFEISNYTRFNILIVGILFYLYNQCFFIATDKGMAGMGAVFVTTTNPIITLLITSLINKKINLKDCVAIFLGLIGGCIILDVFSLGFDKIFLSDNIYFIFCSIIWGVMTVLMSKGQYEIESMLYIVSTYFIATIIGFWYVDIDSISISMLFNTSFIIHFFFVCSAMSIGTSIYILASAKIGPVKSSTFIFSVPFIAMITAYCVLDEQIGFNIFLGGFISILAIILINKKNNNLF